MALSLTTLETARLRRQLDEALANLQTVRAHLAGCVNENTGLRAQLAAEQAAHNDTLEHYRLATLDNAKLEAKNGLVEAENKLWRSLYYSKLDPPIPGINL